MAIEGPSNQKTAEKKAKNKATPEQEAEHKNESYHDNTSSIGDKNTVGLQGEDGSDTEYKPEDDKPFVR